MTFEEWWSSDTLRTNLAPGYKDYVQYVSKSAWDAAIAAERQRCREIVKDVASASSIIGIGVANQIAEKIGE